MDEEIEKARAALAETEALLITAGAGMGVDSGLPDFRGPEGFWRAYPAYQELGLRFEQMANPVHFREDPALGWGFYGHRRNLYRKAEPHSGFARLLKKGRSLPGGCFVFTSNVDGHFQKAAFSADEVFECHGSIGHLQCLDHCGQKIWKAESGEIALDDQTMRALDPLPRCPRCEGLARPNILMFGDGEWDSDRSDKQELRYHRWLGRIDGRRIVILEFGAGTGVPTVRLQSERIAQTFGAQLIRVNPRESQAPRDAISLPLGAEKATKLLFEE